MARRKRVRTRRSAPKRARRRRSSGGGKIQLLKPSAMLYGAARQRISAMLAPLTARIPLGGIADEAGIIGAGWLISKFGKPRGFVKQVVQDAMTIENSRLGEAGAQMALGNGTQRSGTPSMIIYG